jgi:hypothetical protein
MRTGQPLASPKLSLGSSTAIDLSVSVFLSMKIAKHQIKFSDQMINGSSFAD